jgi:glycosyltransferase involved in cell wall biosynthesis
VTQLPIVSVLIGVYNHERFIVEAIESALLQRRDYPADRLEFVLVDDGSTDATPHLIAPYADRIRAIRKPNGGLLSTTNRLLEEARGEFLCFLSGDDFWRPGKIARQVRAIAERPWVTVVYGDSAIVDGDSRVQHESYYTWHRLGRAVGDIRGPLLEKNFVCAPTAMFPARLRDRVWPIGPPAVWEDWWMWFHAAQEGEALYLPGADVCYRVHGANMSAGLDGADQLRFWARELPFRRWLLTETDHAAIPYADVVNAWRAFEWVAHACAEGRHGSLEELIPVGDDERRASAAALVDPPSDPAELVRRLARALAWNPYDVAARALFPDALAAAAHAAPPVITDASIVLALAAELVREPGLLAAYAEAVDAEDDVILLVDARGWSAERVAEELVPLAVGLGIDDGGPDVLVISDGRAWPRDRLVAVLTRDGGTAEALGAAPTADAPSIRACVASATMPPRRAAGLNEDRPAPTTGG